ncbi:MAG: DegT/DnrJ/EryC1/StrS aminotransferase family protein [Verrucomicrobiales bacterium]|nr:DegT/DnrJ/EryC1/StrS aminotransferase family protein [Verrucomicrobiales bacterium]
MFGLQLGGRSISAGESTAPAILRGNHLKLATARGALKVLAERLCPKQVWLPSYLCPVMLDCFGKRVRFYAVGADFRVSDHMWLENVGAGDLVVFIDYFGFRFWDQCGHKAKARGAWVVEDASQALLNEKFSESADYVVSSPRKFVGVPDGGILLARGNQKLTDIKLRQPSSSWRHSAFTACVRRAEFDLNDAGQDRSWYQLYQESEAAAPVQPCVMSEVSQLILRCAIDWQQVAHLRRKNYRYLATALSRFALFPKLQPGMTPLGFPAFFKNRDAVRTALFARNIFPPIHWALKGFVPPDFVDSHDLSARILTLPCDQRYDRVDLKRIVDVIQEVGQ